MSLVARRELLRPSQWLFATSVRGGFPPKQGSGSSRPAAVPAQPSPLCRDVMDYSNVGLGQILTKLRGGVARQPDLIAAARKLKLVAHHLVETGLDVEFRDVARSRNLKQFDQTNPEGLDLTVQVVQRYVPNVAYGDFLPVQGADPTELTEIADYFRGKGLSTFFFDSADALKQIVYSSKLTCFYVLGPWSSVILGALAQGSPSCGWLQTELVCATSAMATAIVAGACK